jgi:hypothetical protein
MYAEAIGTAPLAERSERTQFFARSALVMTGIVVLSFPLSYFLPVATGSGEFHPLHHLHGAAFFAWFGIYAWQTQLVARGQVARHREIGLAGFALTGALVPLGYWMAQRGAERRLGTVPNPYESTWFNLVDISLFAVLMLAAIVLVTRHREWHRRFVFIAALCLIAPAATRWTLQIPGLDGLWLDVVSYLVMYPFLLSLALFDRRALGTLHPATLVGFALLVSVQTSSAWIARSEWWMATAPGFVAAP